ncbi:YfbM family protein [Nocardioides speluncae]|uniref:YfbM family protein n=1 Tax=Nocardioides speluncae TaxID=2670337 RepID=UPI000D68821D|nr:YfbM family protein [Nocardioides speluncae]
MGMILSLIRVTPAELDGLRDDPTPLFSYDEEESATVDGSARTLDVDKAWNAIHYLLTGCGLGEEPEPSPSAAPAILAKAIFSGVILSEETGNGYGPAQLLTADEVRELAAALDVVDIAARYDQSAMQAAELYPAIEWDSDDLDYVRAHFEAMREHLSGAAKAGDAVVQRLY